MINNLDACTAKSFRSYLNTLLIQHATDLLHEGTHLTTSIEGIAERSGFKSKSIFYAAFKEEYDMTLRSGPRSICRESSLNQDYSSVA
jgi:AraC-like DNA-binding protein